MGVVLRREGGIGWPVGRRALVRDEVGVGEKCIRELGEEEEGVYGMLRMRFVVSVSWGVCSNTRRFVSSANLASRIFDLESKESVEMAWADISFGRAIMLGGWVMRWMWSVCVEVGEERVM